MSPRTPRQFEEIREEKRAHIMNVALEHFSNVGFHATTISHIAKHAGISKGLIYNYFNSKEELLTGIINRSLTEVYQYFDPNRDGYLTGEEFELFIRKAFNLLREKRQFWRLLFGIMLQRGVYENLFNSKIGTIKIGTVPLKEFSENMLFQMTDYFRRKQEIKGPGYDPVIEMIMFTNAMKGFALTFIFSDQLYQGDCFEKSIEALISMYK